VETEAGHSVQEEAAEALAEAIRAVVSEVGAGKRA
jgi:hypothetical protein